MYTLVDAGCVPGETTSVTVADFDEPDAPTLLQAPGNSRLLDRLLPLDPFASGVLRVLALSAAAARSTTPLTYAPRSNAPGSHAATASAQRILDRMLKDLGPAGTDLTASSIQLWRVHQLYCVNEQEALRVSGRHRKDYMIESLFRGAQALIQTTDNDSRGGF